MCRTRDDEMEKALERAEQMVEELQEELTKLQTLASERECEHLQRGLSHSCGLLCLGVLGVAQTNSSEAQEIALQQQTHCAARVVHSTELSVNEIRVTACTVSAPSEGGTKPAQRGRVSAVSKHSVISYAGWSS